MELRRFENRETFFVIFELVGMLNLAVAHDGLFFTTGFDFSHKFRHCAEKFLLGGKKLDLALNIFDFFFYFVNFLEYLRTPTGYKKLNLGQVIIG